MHTCKTALRKSATSLAAGPMQAVCCRFERAKAAQSAVTCKPLIGLQTVAVQVDPRKALSSCECLQIISS